MAGLVGIAWTDFDAIDPSGKIGATWPEGLTIIRPGTALTIFVAPDPASPARPVLGAPSITLISSSPEGTVMATRVPPRKRAKKPERRSNAEGLIELLREMAPQPDLAAAIPKVSEERHRGASTRPRGRSQRGQSTRT
jgi:hypothetical protein